MIPAIDHIDEYLATASQNPKYSEAIHTTLALGKQTLHHYYDKTDHSEVYQIVMGKPPHFLFHLYSKLAQFSIPAINYTTLRKQDERKIG